MTVQNISFETRAYVSQTVLKRRNLDVASHNSQTKDQLNAESENDTVARLVEGFILDRQYLEFLSQITIEATKEFVKSIEDVSELLDTQMPKKERLDHAQTFIRIFVDTANKHLKQAIEKEGKNFCKISQPYLAESEKLKAFGNYHEVSEVITLSTRPEHMSDQTSLITCLIAAHEAGHHADLTLKSFHTVQGYLPEFLSEAFRRSEHDVYFDSNTNEQAYRATFLEEHANLIMNRFGAEVLEHIESITGINSAISRLKNHFKREIDRIFMRARIPVEIVSEEVHHLPETPSISRAFGLNLEPAANDSVIPVNVNTSRMISKTAPAPSPM